MDYYALESSVSAIVLACCTLHNKMILRYSGVYQSIADEDENHRLVPDQRREGVNL